jgi:hypothetical protein
MFWATTAGLKSMSEHAEFGKYVYDMRSGHAEFGKYMCPTL